MTSLASGSSGNAFLVQTGGTAVLVDAGITLANLAPALQAAGVQPSALACALLTHEHSDHLASAGALSRRYGVPLLGTAETLGYLKGRLGEREALVPGARRLVGDLAFTPFSVPHDAANPVGYLFEDGDSRVVLATDLGHVPTELLSILRSSQLLILEANHDITRLWGGPYPRSLKERVAAPTGHLSNEQCGDCLVECASGRPQWVWLAHLSDVNNSPRRALQSINRTLAKAEVATLQVQVALRDKPSLSWSPPDACFQARLF
ncbi:MAG: MBL fold metallo-hydrolase [Chloroflexota bacterium]